MNAYYKLYVKSIISLIGTMVIKDTVTADKINDELLVVYGHSVNLDRPDTWKYYLNLSGEYHVTDTPMKVRARETGQWIDFTKDNLRIYRDTRATFNWGTREYKDLVQRYPTQVALIHGILWPIPIDEAIDAPDHKILRYDNRLVESNEVYLIQDLQAFIDNHFKRWHNPDYNLFEPYYQLGHIANFASLLLLEVLRLRKKAIRTDRAHSYHIRQYLMSFSEVGKEFDFMSTRLRLWLYRNLKYINLNIGREETFDDVVDHVMTDRGFSLVGYDLKHRYSNLEELLVPEIIMQGDVLNGIYPSRGGLVKGVDYMVDKEASLARDNVQDGPDVVEYATTSMQKYQGHSMNTKVLESNAVDTTDSEVYTYAEVALNHWIYLSHFDLYSTRILFKNPSDGIEYSLPVKEAFIFYLYAYNRSIGLTLDKVPKVTAHRVLRIPEVTFEELRGMAPADMVTDASINYIRDMLPVPSRMITVAEFKEFCEGVKDVLLTQRFHYAIMGDWRRETEMQRIVDRCYMSICIDLANEMDYTEWLEGIEIDTSLMTENDFSTMADEILTNAIGQGAGERRSVRDIHAAMLRILDTLTSYSVQVIGDINQSPIRAINGKFPKIRAPIASADIEINAIGGAPTVLGLYGSHGVLINLVGEAPKLDYRASQHWVICPVSANMPIKYHSKTNVFRPIPADPPVFKLLPPPDVNLDTLADDQVTDYHPLSTTPIDPHVNLSNPFEDYSALVGHRLALFKAAYVEM